MASGFLNSFTSGHVGGLAVTQHKLPPRIYGIYYLPLTRAGFELHKLKSAPSQLLPVLSKI
jgi:hypothetical protein